MTMQDELNRDDTLSVELLKEWKALWEDDDTLSQEALDTLIIDATSLLQRVFGTMWVASKVYFRDCYPSDNRTVRSIYRDGVAIHRDRHVAQDGMLYNFEAIPAGASFDFHLTAENVDDVEVGVLMIGVRALSEGILRIGGGTSRGLGSVVLENIKIEYVGSDLDSLTDYLTSGAKQTIDYQDMAAKVNALMDYIREGAS
jgi:CRISPR-associated RAMP protein (TIGR02581 family)